MDSPHRREVPGSESCPVLELWGNDVEAGLPGDELDLSSELVFDPPIVGVVFRILIVVDVQEQARVRSVSPDLAHPLARHPPKIRARIVPVNLRETALRWLSWIRVQLILVAAERIWKDLTSFKVPAVVRDVVLPVVVEIGFVFFPSHLLVVYS